MSGIYIHIPFCNSKCAYCGFYSIPSIKRKTDFLAALKQEMVVRKDYLRGETVRTLYFGGGTPSILNVKEIETILKILHDHFEIDPSAEVTLEANPDTLSLDYLEGLRSIGVNRLSIGLQSFFDNDLKYLSRRHDSRHALECVPWAKEAGFENISLDLIYGLPTSDAEQWRRNLDLFFEMDVPHLSAYALTLEPNAILTRQIEQGKAKPVNEEDALRDYSTLCKCAKESGFEHYEISNFCKPGWHSRHNTSYWFGVPYLGLGPSAHSYNGRSRQWNVSSVGRYVEDRRQETEVRKEKAEISNEIENVSEGRLLDSPARQRGEAGYASTGYAEMETLTPEQKYDEYVMLRLRTMWGIDLKDIRQEMGARFADHCERQARPLVEQGRLTRSHDLFFLDDGQMLFADGIAEELFW